MIKIFLLFTFLLFITITQYTEINDARHECHMQRKKDIELLARDICIDQADRLHFESMVDCKGAERRQRQSIPLCTIQHWVMRTDISKIWKKITESYWNILGFVMPIVFMIFYFSHQHHRYQQQYIAIKEK